MPTKRHPTALAAFAHGRILYDHGYMQTMRQRFLEMRRKQGLIRVEGGWNVVPRPRRPGTAPA